MITYSRDVPRGDEGAFEAEHRHIEAHLSAVVDEDDNPDTHVSAVRIEVQPHPENPDVLRLTGFIAGEPRAPYLASGHDQLEGVDLDLLAQFPAAMGLEDSDGPA